jgi:hypothetical protein
MADESENQTVTLEELMVSNLAMAEATVKLLIEKVCLPTKSSKPS